MTDFGPLWQPAYRVAAAVAGREISARALAELALTAIERHNPSLTAFTDVTPEKALADAEAVDRAVAKGAAPPLAGVPFAAKNLFDIEGLVTRAGSKINRDNPPASSDAVVVARLRAAGGLLAGATNMGEYACDFMGESAHDGASLNPHDPRCMAGGSSGGSATAVAAGMTAVGLGSDTNGSIRVPASFCGLFGLKPTYGRLACGGMFPFVPSLDHAGILTRSATDLALVYAVLCRSDPRAGTLAGLSRGANGLRIGVAGGHFRERSFPEAMAALEIVTRALDVQDEIEIAEAARARGAALLISMGESGPHHLERLRRRAADYGPLVRPRFLAGAMMPAAWLVAAQRFRVHFQALLARVFETVDIVLTPATPYCALPSGSRTEVITDGRLHEALPNIGLYTAPFSFAGFPAVAVPIWLPDSPLPIGVQIVAGPGKEDLALRVAHQLEEMGVAVAPVAALVRRDRPVPAPEFTQPYPERAT